MSKLNGTLSAAAAEVAARLTASLALVEGRRMGAGAGVVWRADGLVLTNNHVISERRDHARVTLADDRQFDARVLARDAEVDLALLEIEGGGEFPAARIGDSRTLRVGELVFAIGHPWGLRNTVTGGIISHLTTAHTDGPRREFPVIRTDARLAPGNSGGPLVNAAGEVVGLNAMIFGGDQGIAIPSAVAQEFIAAAGVQNTTTEEPTRVHAEWL